jgi:acyl-CoA reductase-like NAD-dependent aldehyde dehydrogenase
LEIARLAREAGIPAGVINVVTGYGDPAGDTLSASPQVDFVSFTGSTRVGRRIIENSAASVKKTSVELGGKAANIVFADADLDDAVDGVMMGIFFNQGEVCCSGTRLLVQEEVADDFVGRLVGRTAGLKVGDPFEDDTDVGAMIHGQHMDRVLGFVEAAKQDGATLLTGGERVVEGVSNGGSFVAPTIFDHVSPSMAVFREEIFGPVLSTTRFKTVDDAIALANDTEYGLANALWSRGLETAMRVSRALRSGTVWVNTVIDGAPQLPFGGYKASGFGREMGNAGLEEFTQAKTILLHTGPRSRVFA